MHPAFSVIFLTTLIGAGQGLFLALVTGQVYSVANLLEPQSHLEFYGMGSLLSLVLLVLGLVASFFHLGRPERGWRAAAMWRTSWLSREVIILPIFMGLVFLYGAVHALNWTAPLFVIRDTLPLDLSLILGVIGSVVAFALFICTAMIYASLRFLQEWHSPLTAVNFTLLGLASGFTLAAGFAAWQGASLVPFYVGWALIFTVLGAAGRFASLYRNARLVPKSTLQTAIGVRHSRIQQKSMGFMGGSFNTREFFHHRSPGFVLLMRNAFVLLAFVVPLVLLASSYGVDAVSLVLAAAFAVQYLGLVMERWYFFAEARHPQNLYYQTVG